MFKIEEKIVKVSVSNKRVHLTEVVKRPIQLSGATYKIKTPLSEHSTYVTINDIIMNDGTKFEERRPFEMFINSKNMNEFAWVTALTRVISAVFRKGGDIVFLVDELNQVFDPKGGYFKKGGKYMPSVVAEIGDVLKEHMEKLGIIEKEGLSDQQIALIEEKKKKELPTSICPNCNEKALVKEGGCETCLNCGEGRCE